MPRTHKFNSRSEGMVKISTTERVDYSKFATPEWEFLISVFRFWPDILEDICEGERAEYSNSLMNRVTKRYMARYRETFTFACRGYGKTSCLISDKCNKGILWPGEITGYYAPAEAQAAPLASKAYAGWERNVPLLAAHWKRISDREDRFAVATINGSRFIMDIDRGIDTSGVVAEECAQEDKNPFNWTDFNQIVLGTNRLDHKANGVSVPSHIDSQIHYISSCSRQENESYSVYKSIRQEMMEGGSAFALSIPWQVPVLCRMKKMSYYQMLRKRLTAEQFDRECNSHCTGSAENPIVRDNVIRESRNLMTMEDKHCGNPEAFYILGYDVSSRDHGGNALSAMSVLKCERQFNTAKWDRYRKSLVYVMDMRPPKTAREHAAILKKRWAEYSIQGSTAFMVVDARSYGQSVIECLHEDLGDGLPPLRTMNNDPDFAGLVRPGAIPCLYAIQAMGNTGRDPNSIMLDYIEREFENGNLRLLTADLAAGVKSYKLKKGIKDDTQDALIQFPYLKTNALCRQIANLQKKYTSTGWVEAEISKYIPKDMWSSLLYANRIAQYLEKDQLYAQNHYESEWEKAAREMENATSGFVVRTRANRRQGRLAIK